MAPKGTWWPVLTFDLCVLAADGNGFGPHQLTKFFAHGSFSLFTRNCEWKGHSTTNRCLPMSARGEEKIRTKLKNVGKLTLFTKISPESERETSPAEERTRSPTRLVWILVSALPVANHFDFHPPGSTHNINIVHRVKRKIPLQKYKDGGNVRLSQLTPWQAA